MKNTIQEFIASQIADVKELTTPEQWVTPNRRLVDPTPANAKLRVMQLSHHVGTQALRYTLRFNQGVYSVTDVVYTHCDSINDARTFSISRLPNAAIPRVIMCSTRHNEYLRALELNSSGICELVQLAVNLFDQPRSKA